MQVQEDDQSFLPVSLVTSLDTAPVTCCVHLLAHVETAKQNCAELSTVAVAASACEQLQLTCVKILSDHEAVLPGIAGPKTRDAKFKYVLWKRLAIVLHRTRFEVAWVPGHGRARHRHVLDVCRLLNNAADHAAEDASKHS